MNPFDYPLLVLVASLALFWGSARLGAAIRSSRRGAEGRDEDFSFVLGGTLTLLGLLIGFTFSMAVGRYDQRKNLEEQEANAIGTEYVRADLLPAADAAKVRALLRSYLDVRISIYRTREPAAVRRLDAENARLQGDLWAVAAAHGVAQRDPVAALVVAGMNDVLNSQGYTQAARWNRIPIAAWMLLLSIAIFCNLLIGFGGFGARGRSSTLLLILPVALAITLFLIADIESPVGGVIRVHPENLQAVAASIRAP